MGFLNKRKDFTALSLPRSKTVRGIEIRRAPLGKYLEIMEILYGFSEEVLGECFGDKNGEEILAGIKALDGEIIRAVTEGVFKKGPMALVRAVALITEVPQERLLYDEDIGLDGLLEIIEALIEVNRLGKLAAGAQGIFQGLKEI